MNGEIDALSPAYAPMHGDAHSEITRGEVASESVDQTSVSGCGLAENVDGNGRRVGGMRNCSHWRWPICELNALPKRFRVKVEAA